MQGKFHRTSIKTAAEFERGLMQANAKGTKWVSLVEILQAGVETAHTLTYAHANTQMHIHAHMHTQMHVHAHEHVHARMHESRHERKCRRKHTHSRTHIHISMHTCPYITYSRARMGTCTTHAHTHIDLIGWRRKRGRRRKEGVRGRT